MAVYFYLIPVFVFIFIIIVIGIVMCCVHCVSQTNTQTRTITFQTTAPTTQTTVVQHHTPVTGTVYTTSPVVQQPVYGSPPPPPQYVQQSPPCASCQGIKPLSVIIPCGHECVCLDCGTLLRNQGNLCPACHGVIESVWPK